MKKLFTLSLPLLLSSSTLFASDTKAKQISPVAELQECSAKIRGGAENDMATLRISIDVSSGPDWEVGLLTQLLERECNISKAAQDLLDWEENSYLKKETFKSTRPGTEGPGSPELDNGIFRLYGDFGEFYILPAIGDQYTVVHHRAD